MYFLNKLKDQTKKKALHHCPIKQFQGYPRKKKEKKTPKIWLEYKNIQNKLLSSQGNVKHMQF